MWVPSKKMALRTIARPVMISGRTLTNRYDFEMNSNEIKKTCLTKSIGTHDGTFHCDDVLACWMLRQLSQYHNADIIRTRDQALLDTCDVVVDVGGVYDSTKNRYDHHQRYFSGTMKSLGGKKWETKLSSAGLVFLHFGKQLIAEISNFDESSAVVELLYNKMYENFIEEIDAIDNGISQHDGEPRYRITTCLSSRIANLNPSWNEKNADVKTCFTNAMVVAGGEFLDRLQYYKDSWLPARTFVESAVLDRTAVDSSGEILLLLHSGCPWKEHLFAIEEELLLGPLIKFVLYEDEHKNWRVQTVPTRLGSFEHRVGLIEAWRGLRGDELSKVSGVDGCVFVHASGFIGGNCTYEGALKMARLALESYHSVDQN